MEIKDPETINVIKYLVSKRHMSLTQDRAVAITIEDLNISLFDNIRQIKTFAKSYLGDKRFWESDVYNYLSVYMIQGYLLKYSNTRITLPTNKLPHEFDMRDILEHGSTRS